MDSHGDVATVAVTDTGIGISATDQAHLFDAFHRSSNLDALSIPGTGLGLAIARRIARLESWGAGGENELWRAASPWLQANLPQIRLEPILKDTFGIMAGETPQSGGLDERTAAADVPESMSSADMSYAGGYGGERTTFTADRLSDTGGSAPAWAFDGADAVAGAERLIEALPDHHFTLHGHLVADAAVKAVDHTLDPPRLVAELELLLLEEA